MTKKEMFAVIATAINPDLLPDNVSLDDVTMFCEKQIEQLSRKSGSRKPTARQIANEGLRTQILDVLVSEDRPLRFSEICKKIPALEDASSQKMVMLIRPMILDGKVEKTYIKKVAHFTAI